MFCCRRSDSIHCRALPPSAPANWQRHIFRQLIQNLARWCLSSNPAKWRSVPGRCFGNNILRIIEWCGYATWTAHPRKSRSGISTRKPKGWRSTCLRWRRAPHLRRFKIRWPTCAHPTDVHGTGNKRIILCASTCLRRRTRCLRRSIDRIWAGFRKNSGTCFFKSSCTRRLPRSREILECRM